MKRYLRPAAFICLSLFLWSEAMAGQRPGLRELGVVIGTLPTGAHNDITDVPGVLVGHRTIIRGEAIRTGVTAILPHGGNLFLEKVEGAVEVFNGFGKLAGSTQVNELGRIETPILLTNTLCVSRVADALLSYMLSLPGMEKVQSINPLVAETNDGFLNDIQARAITQEDVFEALRSANGGPLELGSVGAGCGTTCLGYKGGIGSASRVVEIEGGRYTLGVLAQTNFGGRLTVNGKVLEAKAEIEKPGSGSCILVLATDAPLESRNLRRLARRAFAGMARSGADFSNGSGDYAIAFSVHPDFREVMGEGSLGRSRRPLNNEPAGALFRAAAEAAEEAIISSVVAATTITGYQGHRREALDLDILKKASPGQK